MRRSLKPHLSVLNALWMLALGCTASLSQAPLSITNDPLRSGMDVLLGRDNPGPYILSWKPIDPSTLVVNENGRKLIEGLDYSINASAGTITFTRPIKRDNVIRADYKFPALTATRNTGAGIGASQINLLQGQRSGVTLDALFQPGASATSGAVANDGGGLLLGLGVNSRTGGGSTFGSKIYLNSTGGNLLRTGAILLNEQGAIGSAAFKAAYTRTGQDFQGPADLKLTAGREIVESEANSKLFGGLKGFSRWKQETLLGLPSSPNDRMTTLTNGLTGSLWNGGRLAFTRTNTLAEPGAGDASRKTNDRFQLDQQLDKRTAATAIVDRNETQSAGVGTVTQSSTIDVRSRVTDNIGVQGSYTNRLFAQGAEDTFRLRLEADATKTLKIVANSEDRINKADILHRRETTLEYNPNRKYSVSSGIQTRTDPTSTLTAGSFGAGAKPLPFLDLNGSVKLRDQVDVKGQNMRAPDTMAVTAGVSIPDGKLKLTAGLTENPEDAASGLISRVRRKTVGLQSKLGVFDVAGSVSTDEDYLSGGEGSILDVSLGYRIGRFTQIVTGLRDTNTLGADSLFQRTYTLGFTHRYGSLLDLSLGGAYSNSYRNGLLQPNPEMRAEAKVGIRF